MRIVGACGINTRGHGSIDLLLLELAHRGHVVIDVPLPKRHALSARWGGCGDGTIIAHHSRDGDVLVGHSFGALRAWYAHQVREYKAIICIAPAMSDAQRWRYPDRVHCLYSPKDWAIRIGARLLLHPFGAAGSKGFEQDEITNVEYQCGHSGYFAPDLIVGVADYVEQVARS